MGSTEVQGELASWPVLWFGDIVTSQRPGYPLPNRNNRKNSHSHYFQSCCENPASPHIKFLVNENKTKSSTEAQSLNKYPQSELSHRRQDSHLPRLTCHVTRIPSASGLQPHPLCLSQALRSCPDCGVPSPDPMQRATEGSEGGPVLRFLETLPGLPIPD